MSTFNPFDVDKSYVSPYDELLDKLAKKGFSESQRNEYEKHQKIAKLRDSVQAVDTGIIGKDF